MARNASVHCANRAGTAYLWAKKPLILLVLTVRLAGTWPPATERKGAVVAVPLKTAELRRPRRQLQLAAKEGRQRDDATREGSGCDILDGFWPARDSSPPADRSVL